MTEASGLPNWVICQETQLIERKTRDLEHAELDLIGCRIQDMPSKNQLVRRRIANTKGYKPGFSTRRTSRERRREQRSSINVPYGTRWKGKKSERECRIRLLD